MNMKERYLAATDFGSYLESVEKNKDLWHGVYQRVSIPPEILEEARRLPSEWHLLALSEDWCGDAVNLLPVLAQLAEEAPGLDFRVLSRDENLDLMDAHLTGGESRSIPVVLMLDEDFVERGWWGPRPGPLQDWVVTEGVAMPSAERYKHVRRFYAKDKGRTMLREVLDLMDSAA
jgi:thiol-disulfide isomerase/thioredoxin